VTESRTPSHRYRDPLDLVWLRAAEKLGLRVVQSGDAYASYDGKGTLTVGAPGDLDPDDCLAQLIFHELCHALVAGDAAFERLDWGLSNTDDRDLVLEHACNRLQAWLASRHGLRWLLAVTTEHREYYDALPDRPLEPGDDPAIALARAAALRARAAPWRETLDEALELTAELARVMRPSSPEDSLWRLAGWRHRTGFPLHFRSGLVCGDCAWSYRGENGKPLRCRQGRRPGRAGTLLDTAEPACARWEPRLVGDDCGGCGACCREGFDLVPVEPGERMERRHLALLQSSSLGLHVPRPGGRCAALDGEGTTLGPYRCRVYADRPRACQKFAVGGDACLTARRRVGLSM
jgi:hypothetical protein